MFTLKINTESDAFEDGIDLEVARILNTAAKKIESGATEGRLQDVNGKTVGSFELTD